MPMFIGGECPCMLWAFASVLCNLQGTCGDFVYRDMKFQFFLQALILIGFACGVYRGEFACMSWVSTSVFM